MCATGERANQAEKPVSGKTLKGGISGVFKKRQGDHRLGAKGKKYRVIEEAVKIITREQNIKEHKVTESIFVSV